MIAFNTIQVSICFVLTVALIMRKCDEEIDKIMERFRKDTNEQHSKST